MRQYSALLIVLSVACSALSVQGVWLRSYSDTNENCVTPSDNIGGLVSGECSLWIQNSRQAYFPASGTFGSQRVTCTDGVVTIERWHGMQGCPGTANITATAGTNTSAYEDGTCIDGPAHGTHASNFRAYCEEPEEMLNKMMHHHLYDDDDCITPLYGPIYANERNGNCSQTGVSSSESTFCTAGGGASQTAITYIFTDVGTCNVADWYAARQDYIGTCMGKYDLAADRTVYTKHTCPSGDNIGPVPPTAWPPGEAHETLLYDSCPDEDCSGEGCHTWFVSRMGYCAPSGPFSYSLTCSADGNNFFSQLWLQGGCTGTLSMAVGRPGNGVSTCRGGAYAQCPDPEDLLPATTIQSVPAIVRVEYPIVAGVENCNQSYYATATYSTPDSCSGFFNMYSATPTTITSTRYSGFGCTGTPTHTETQSDTCINGGGDPLLGDHTHLITSSRSTDRKFDLGIPFQTYPGLGAAAHTAPSALLAMVIAAVIVMMRI